MAERIQRGEEHRTPRVRLRARDVGQRGDVVPVDPVPEPKAQRGDDEPDVERLIGGGRGYVLEHARPPVDSAIGIDSEPRSVPDAADATSP